MFLWISCTATPEIPSSSQNTNNMARVSVYISLSYDLTVSTVDEQWHIKIKQLIQIAHIYTLPVVEHEQIITNDATISIINAIICYSK